LNQFKIDQTELAAFFESAQSTLNDIETTRDKLQMDMFNECLLKFDKPKSFDSNVIGKIVKQNIELYFLENIDNMRKLDFASKIECANCFSILQPFKSNSYWFLYSEKNILNLLCLDKDGNTLFDKKDLIKNKEIEEIKFLCFRSSFNKTLYICTGEKHSNQTNTFYNLRSFDENFNFLAEIKLDKKPEPGFSYFYIFSKIIIIIIIWITSNIINHISSIS
jgi:hypothetical protein